MWKESKWVKKQGDERFDYFRDEDTCSFCQQCNDEDYCTDGFLITVLKWNESRHMTLNLHAIVPFERRFEKISICNAENGSYVLKKTADKSFYVKLTKEQAERIIMQIPLFDEDNILPKQIFNAGLNFFKGEKKEWFEYYSDRFEELSVLVEHKGEEVRSGLNSPLKSSKKRVLY